MSDDTASRSRNFIESIIDGHRKTGAYDGRVRTRFPPEPNGFLHIGHAKSICLNFGLGLQYGGETNLRFDDTNPAAEEQRFVDSILQDVRWLGFEPTRVVHASSYFDQLYAWAEKLVQDGRAYVCSLSLEEVRAQRGDLTTPGVPSPYRDRPVEESLTLLREMRDGLHPEGSHTLRAKIDMASPNVLMRDPLMYRIKHATHHATGDRWHIYPMYDYAHGLSDAIEGITHSICTLEFENNRELYDWFVDAVGFEQPPRQYEMARLNLTYTVMSKRKLKQLVEDAHVHGWDDPRMPTISGLRRRGVPASALRTFCQKVGVAKANSTVDIALLEHTIRDSLASSSPRRFAVVDPIPLEVTTWPADSRKEFSVWDFPDEQGAERTLSFSRTLYIDRSDIALDPPKGWRRLAPGARVRLRHAWVLTCDAIDVDEDGRITKVYASHDPDTWGRQPTDGKVRGVIHWVDASSAVPLDLHLVDRLFTVESPGADGDPMTQLNPDALLTHAAKGEPSLRDLPPGQHVQLERLGYFYKDPVSNHEALSLTRTIGLKDAWARKQTGPSPSTKVSSPTAPAGPRKTKAEVREAWLAANPELAAAHSRYTQTHGLTDELADPITRHAASCAWFDRVLESVQNPSTGATWMVNGVLAHVEAEALDTLPFGPGELAELANMVEEGSLNTGLAKKTLAVMFENGVNPETIARTNKWVVLTDPDVLNTHIAAVLEANPNQLSAYRGGKKKLFGFFIGKVMGATGGTAEPNLLRKLLAAALEG